MHQYRHKCETTVRRDAAIWATCIKIMKNRQHYDTDAAAAGAWH